MSENQHVFQDFSQANAYVQTVRQHYRDDHAEYSGRRNPDQQAIAEMTADEARLVVDGVMVGMLALHTGGQVQFPDDYEDVQYGGHSWKHFREEFGRLLVGFGVITNRLNREGYKVPSYIELDDEDRFKVNSVMLGDYLEHNALRFGVDSSGLRATRRVHNDEGGVDVHVVDPDKARDDRDIQGNMARRGFSSNPATHAAGKMSPDEYRALRKDFPEIDKDNFDQAASFYKDARNELESRGQ